MRGAPAWAVTFLGAVSVGAGRLFGLIELYIIGTGLVLGVLIAVVQVRSRFIHLSLQRDIEPVHPSAGTEMKVVLTLESRRRTPSCELIDIVDGTGRVGLMLTPLAKLRIARVRYIVPARRRGILTLGPAMIELSDPLGLLRRRHHIGNPTKVIVHPQWTSIDLPDPRHCEGVLIDLIHRLLNQMVINLEFRSLREYVTGDDLRRINWKASARRDILTLNEFESRAPLVVQVALDQEKSAYSSEGFERAVSIATSFVGSALAVQHEFEPRIHLSLPPHFNAVIDPSTHLDAMQCLAQIDRDSIPHIHSPLKDPGEFRVNVIICGNRDSRWLEYTDRSMGVGQATVIIYCETPSGQTLDHDHWIALPCHDFAAFATAWGTLSRRKAHG